jgi:hypothetical protein
MISITLVASWAAMAAAELLGATAVLAAPAERQVLLDGRRVATLPRTAAVGQNQTFVHDGPHLKPVI